MREPDATPPPGCPEASPFGPPSCPIKTLCYRGLPGGPRRMGKVGAALVSHLLARPQYRAYFWPWDNDFMKDYWSDEVDRIVIHSPEALGIDQSTTFWSVLNAREAHWAPQTTVWLYWADRSWLRPKSQ